MTSVIAKRFATGGADEVYIGRGSKWGNPFSHKTGTLAQYIVGSREEAVDKYRRWILDQTNLLLDIPELFDKTLVCFCKPKECHGDVLVDLVNDRQNAQAIVTDCTVCGSHIISLCGCIKHSNYTEYCKTHYHLIMKECI